MTLSGVGVVTLQNISLKALSVGIEKNIMAKVELIGVGFWRFLS